MKATANERREWRAGILFLLPNFIGFTAFTALPIIMGLLLSFTNYNGSIKMTHFVGLGNYVNLFHDSNFYSSLKNTLIYTLITVPASIFVALLLALAMVRKIPLRGMFRTVFFFPYITSMAAVAIIWSLMFNPIGGPVNALLSFIGIKNPPGWIVSTKWALYAVIIVSVWKMAGYYMIMLISGLTNIPGQLYEAAEIDGANAWKRFRYVTWPMLSPVMFMVTVLAVIFSFQVFDLVNIMTQGGPGDSTNVLVLRIYQEGFQYMKLGYASAMAYFLFLVIFLFTLIQFKGQKNWVTTLQ